MKPKSILLALDGTIQCRQAMDLCFKLAQSKSLQLTAQHVVDNRGLWDFLRYDLPGLTGSGPYIAAHEAMIRELRLLGQTLIDAYQTQAESHGIAAHTFLDEGSPVQEIYRRSQASDLVVIGHRASGLRSPAEDRRIFPRYSVAEKLSQYIDRPLLVVQDQCQPWSSVTLVFSGERAHLSSFSGCLELASFFGVPLKVCHWIQAGANRQRLDSLVDLLNRIGRTMPDVKIEHMSAEAPQSWWMPNIEFEHDTLVVVPTLEYNSVRETSFGTPPDQLVRHNVLPCVLLWAESADERARFEAASSLLVND